MDKMVRAPDALSVAPMFGKTAKISSVCRITHIPVAIHMSERSH